MEMDKPVTSRVGEAAAKVFCADARVAGADVKALYTDFAATLQVRVIGHVDDWGAIKTPPALTAFDNYIVQNDAGLADQLGIQARQQKEALVAKKRAIWEKSFAKADDFVAFARAAFPPGLVDLALKDSNPH